MKRHRNKLAMDTAASLNKTRTGVHMQAHA